MQKQPWAPLLTRTEATACSGPERSKRPSRCKVRGQGLAPSTRHQEEDKKSQVRTAASLSLA